MLCVRHQQMDIVDDEQLSLHIVEATLCDTVNPLVVLRGIHFLEAGIGEDTIRQEQLMDEVDDEAV